MTVTGNPSDADTVPCGACWNQHPLADMANLIDRNGQAWFICPDCLNKLWHSEQPMAQPEPATELDSYMVACFNALPYIVGSVSVLTEMLADELPHCSPTVERLIGRIHEELDKGRKAYEPS